MAYSTITWILERNVFTEGERMRQAVSVAGHRVIDWSDDWFSDLARPNWNEAALFHGSLGHADRIARELPWKPGAYCRTERFCCSAWYPDAREWLLHQRWEIHPASKFVANADAILERLGGNDSIFVRPDSPLKPFSGRILHRKDISLARLDHGFYYDDTELPVIVAPVRQISLEWRYVVVDREVIAGSGYIANGRAATSDDPQGASWKFAAQVARQIPPPEPVYVLDVCETDSELRLLELNPFSGADLYGCNLSDVVRSVSEVAARTG